MQEHFNENFNVNFDILLEQSNCASVGHKKDLRVDQFLEKPPSFMTHAPPSKKITIQPLVKDKPILSHLI